MIIWPYNSWVKHLFFTLIFAVLLTKWILVKILNSVQQHQDYKNLCVNSTSVSNFIKIGPVVQNLQRFYELQDGGRRHLGLNFFALSCTICGLISRKELPFQISWKSVHWFKSYSAFTNFKMAAAAILDFV